MKKERTVTLHALGVQTMPPVVQEAHLTVIRSFSIQYLMGAARYSRAVQTVERENTSGFGPHWDRLYTDSCSAVMFSVLAVEAFVNELIFGRKTLFGSRGIDTSEVSWEKAQKCRGLSNKIKAVVRNVDGTQPDFGSADFQAFQTLEELRHQLVHYKVSWDFTDERTDKLSKALARFAPNKSPYLKSEQSLWPMAWATHATTKWAVETATKIIDVTAASALLEPNPLDNHRAAIVPYGS